MNSAPTTSADHRCKRRKGGLGESAAATIANAHRQHIRFSARNIPQKCLLPKTLILFLVLPQLIGIGLSSAMRVDPERLAARLRIEEEMANDRLALSRNRRQLGGSPKEETIKITAQLFSGRLFDYGPEVGDQELQPGLDVAKKIQLTQPITFYGKSYEAIYVLSNGGVGFDPSVKSYRANILPGNTRIIAPFWNRNELHSGGHVYYREITNGRVLERGQSEIRYQYEHEVKVLSTIVVTWEKMQPLGTEPLPAENTNTFQLALFATTNGTYANFIYKNIGWTQGAEAGFSNGDNTNHFALPTSGTGNIMYLEDYGNTGIPGEWMFAFDAMRVVRCKVGIKGDTCDETCADKEWGADCAGCCHCEADGACDSVTGTCRDNGGACADCWTGFNCQQKTECRKSAQQTCAHNAASFTDFDRCGEPLQRCECLAGYEGKGTEECRDIDECAQPGTCHTNAVCTNTPGRFFCQCVPGFSGDGVSECVASFLYPYAAGQKLTKTRHTRVTLVLKYPLKLFGKTRQRLLISTNGLIVAKQVAKVNPGDRLDDMQIFGIAPFYAPIDLSATKNSQVVVLETTDADALTRATQLVRDNLASGANGEAFRATSVLVITFANVSTAKSPAITNTFQTVLIGGVNQQEEDVTYVQFLYKDLMWSDGAEAGIITPDHTNSIILPGSGTAGIEQLSQLSNVRSPGVWVYRVDADTLSMCMHDDLQPPYCDAPTPTLVNAHRPSPTSSPAGLSAVVTAAPTTTAFAERPTDLDVDIQGFSDASFPSAEASLPQRVTPAFPTIESRQMTSTQSSSANDEVENTGVWSPPPISPHHPRPPLSTARLPPPPFGGAALDPHDVTVGGRRPTFNSRELEDMPPDAFDFPPSITIIPKVISGGGSGASNGDAIAGISLISPELLTTASASSTVSESGAQPTLPSNTVVEEHAFALPDQSIIHPEIVRPEVSRPSEASVDEKSRKIVDSVAFQTEKSVVNAGEESSIIVTSPAPPISDSADSTTPREAQFTLITATATSAAVQSTEEDEAVARGNNSSTNPLFVFTTTPKLQKPSKPKLVIGGPQQSSPKKRPSGEDVDGMVHGGGASLPYDPDRVLDAEAPANKFALVITVSVIAGWLFVLLGVGAYVACKRRRNQDMLRAMYGPAYQIRPIGVGFAAMRDVDGPKLSHQPIHHHPHHHHYEASSYEDHLEKAARLSSELGAYNPGGRISLYGSYWNLSNESAASGSTSSGGSPLAVAVSSGGRLRRHGQFAHHHHHNNNHNSQQHHRDLALHETAHRRVEQHFSGGDHHTPSQQYFHGATSGFMTVTSRYPSDGEEDACPQTSPAAASTASSAEMTTLRTTPLSEEAEKSTGGNNGCFSDSGDEQRRLRRVKSRGNLTAAGVSGKVVGNSSAADSGRTNHAFTHHGSPTARRADDKLTPNSSSGAKASALQNLPRNASSNNNNSNSRIGIGSTNNNNQQYHLRYDHGGTNRLLHHLPPHVAGSYVSLFNTSSATTLGAQATSVGQRYPPTMRR